MGLYLVSEQLNVSNSYLSTAFKNAYGVSLVQYLNRLRVEHAKKLILEPPMSIKEIALASGFPATSISFVCSRSRKTLLRPCCAKSRRKSPHLLECRFVINKKGLTDFFKSVRPFSFRIN